MQNKIIALEKAVYGRMWEHSLYLSYSARRIDN